MCTVFCRWWNPEIRDTFRMVASLPCWVWTSFNTSTRHRTLKPVGTWGVAYHWGLCCRADTTDMHAERPWRRRCHEDRRVHHRLGHIQLFSRSGYQLAPPRQEPPCSIWSITVLGRLHIPSSHRAGHWDSLGQQLPQVHQTSD